MAGACGQRDHHARLEARLRGAKVLPATGSKLGPPIHWR